MMGGFLAKDKHVPNRGDLKIKYITTHHHRKLNIVLYIKTQHYHMFTGTTKSAIQVVAETYKAKCDFITSLEEIFEKYTIKNNVFACGAHGEAEEPTEGYFGQVAEFASIEEASKEFNPFIQGIRIQEDKVFVGNLYKNLIDVKEEYIIDLKNKTVI